MGQFYYRPEDDEARLIRRAGTDAFDRAVVQARYLGPYPESSSRYGQEPRELALALREHGAPWLVDLCTPALCHRDIQRADSCGRLRECDFVKLLGLPLDPAALTDSGARDAFVDVALEFQIDAPLRSAPYFEIADEDDPFVELNLAMLRRVVGAAGQEAIGFLQLTLDGLNRGLPGRLAARYADTGIKLLLLRVRNLQAEAATGRQFGSYLDAVAAYRGREINVVADQVGRLGPPAIAGGAVGFSGGGQYFRSVPGQVVTVGGGGGGGGAKLAVELADRWTTAARDEIPAGTTCPVPGCRFAGGSRDPDDLREHNLHYLRYQAGLADDIAALVCSLRGSGQADALAWAAELERRVQLIA